MALQILSDGIDIDLRCACVVVIVQIAGYRVKENCRWAGVIMDLQITADSISCTRMRGADLNSDVIIMEFQTAVDGRAANLTLVRPADNVVNFSITSDS